MSAASDLNEELIRRLTANFPPAAGPDSLYAFSLKFKPLPADYWERLSAAMREFRLEWKRGKLRVIGRTA